ncbi:DMP19 family protein [Pelobacter propionicus]|uniref:DNA mimic protein DMP19 C-terminal domain-containing protein n=1 Tax=Pelobacter propionicus (strain DSM 2379 / NBRC 103807 / OttBd1) TaxID=338966 RepID=A1AMJ3_PELPD|nr:DMP19 family protein [Pelobacter propionicus]ABK98563.1 hypothetical protein Ppro_0934 [Pelobacter propionicus DSM 2379]
MNKIPCIQCGVMILASTAEKTGGLCTPCKTGTRESLEESRQWNKNRRDQLAKAESEREPIEVLRKSGHKMQFHHYHGLEDPAYEIFRAALDTVYDKGNGKNEHIERLSKECRLVYLLWCFDGEIHNGGFDQLFTNSLGNHCLEILQDLDVIGAKKSYDLLRIALSWFPNSSPSTNRRERWTQYELFSEQQKYQTDMDRLDKEFYKDEDKLANLICDYVMHHGSAFIVESDGQL